MHFFKPLPSSINPPPDPDIQEKFSRIKDFFFWKKLFSQQLSNRDIGDSLMREESLGNQEFEIVSELQIFLMLM